MTNGDHWRAFVETVRGTRNAYAPVHEVRQGHLAREFAAHHENLERRLSALAPDKAEEVRRRDRALQDTLRERGAGRTRAWASAASWSP